MIFYDGNVQNQDKCIPSYITSIDIYKKADIHLKIPENPNKLKNLN